MGDLLGVHVCHLPLDELGASRQHAESRAVAAGARFQIPGT